MAAETFASELASCEHAVLERPDDAVAHFHLAAAYQKLDREEDAVLAYQAAIALRPDYAAAHQNLGNAFYFLGRKKEAFAAYERAAAISPTPGIYRNMTYVHHFAAGEPHLEGMKRLLDRAASMSRDEQVDLRFALGGALDDIGDHEGAFSHFVAGNALKRSMISYDEVAMIATFEKIAAMFSASSMGAAAGAGDASRLPVFVLGMPRSGTTLVDQILSSHGAVHGAGELGAFRDAVSGRPGQPLSPRDFLSPLKSRDPSATAAAIGARYVQAVTPLAPAATRIVDKQLFNFYLIGLIHLALPRAKIIHVHRDPMDTCFSCFTTLFADDHHFTYDQGELGRYYRAYERMMAHWRGVLPPGVMLDVRYEEVVADLEAQARQIVTHVGLDWDPACLSFHNTARPVRNASAGQVREPLYTSSVGRHAPYAAYLQPMKDALAAEGSSTAAKGAALVRALRLQDE